MKMNAALAAKRHIHLDNELWLDDYDVWSALMKALGCSKYRETRLWTYYVSEESSNFQGAWPTKENYIYGAGIIWKGKGLK